VPVPEHRAIGRRRDTNVRIGRVGPRQWPLRSRSASLNNQRRRDQQSAMRRAPRGGNPSPTQIWGHANPLSVQHRCSARTAVRFRRAGSKRQQGSRRSIDAVETPPEQTFRASNRYAVGNDHRDNGNRKIRRNGRHAKKPAAVLVLVSRRVCGWRMVVIGVIGRMMVARHCLDFIQAVCTRRVDGESNGNSRGHQREQVKCGDRKTYFAAPVFSRDQ